MLLKGIILICSAQIQQSRTVSAIYHLLTGKKSIQTIQDAHLFQISHLYGIYRTLTKQTYEKNIEALRKEDLIRITKENDNLYMSITEKGEAWLMENQNNFDLTVFQGLKYGEIGVVFYKRFVLLIQTLTNIRMGLNMFIPVIDQREITGWTKQFYRSIKGQEKDLLGQVYDELLACLKGLEEQKAGIFIDRLTGYKRYGLTTEQIAVKYDLELDDIPLILTKVTHHILSLLALDPNNYPFLNKLIADIKNQIALSQSAGITLQLLRNNRTIAEIIEMRRLKINTIYDHIVEIALYDIAFSIAPFMTKEIEAAILNALQQSATDTLKEIKRMIDPEISYFQIRLVLTRLQNSHLHIQ